MLLWGQARALSGFFAEAEEQSQRVAQLRKRFILRLGYPGVFHSN